MQGKLIILRTSYAVERNLLDILRILRNMCAFGTPTIAILIESRVHEHAAALMQAAGKNCPIFFCPNLENSLLQSLISR